MKIKYLFLLSVLMLVVASASGQTTTIDSTKTYQTIEGLGGATAFWVGNLSGHPYKMEIYTNAFAGLNLSMLRLGGWYRYQSSVIGFDGAANDVVANANLVLGHPVPIYISSWAPPAFLKSNGQVANGGTLITNSDGHFAYDRFAQYWYDSIQAYRSNGISPTWISIQNEPDWVAGYDSCIFHPTEDRVNGTNYASYSKALDAVYQKLTNMPSPPKLLAPEVVHIAFNDLANYAATLNVNSFYGINYHLYGGNNSDLSSSTNIFPGKPHFMTEFGVDGMIDAATLIHNCLTLAQASGFNFWSLAWPGTSGGLIQLEQNTSDPSTWTNAPPGTLTQSRGWWLAPSYWAMKHFSYFINPSFRRVSATDTDNNVLSSAYLSPDGLRLVVVLINSSAATTSAMNFNFGTFSVGKSSVYQTAGENTYRGTNTFLSLGALPSAQALPPRSITTVVLDKIITVGAASNPFPTNGASGVALDSSLSWTPGSNAVTHAVYFGTSSNAVANATTASPEFKGIAWTNNFSLSGASWSTTYYWRVDEIAYINTNRGSVIGSFTTAPAVQLPSPWQSQDIGATAGSSSAIYNNGVFAVTGSGADIWNAADAFRFAYVTATGNCTIIARVTSVQNIDVWSKAGVMIRDSLNANAANAFIAVTPGNGVTWQYRSSNGGNSGNNATPGLNAPYWVKLVRNGNIFTAYRSPNGITWTQQGTPQTLAISPTAYIGLAVTSHNNSSLCTATFDNVTAPGWTAPVPPVGLIAIAGNRQVAITWSASTTATSYNVKRATVNDGSYTIATNVTTTNYTDAGLVNGTTYYYVVSALNPAGESANSGQVTVIPQVAPTGLTSTAVSASQINLVWNTSSNATSYNVKRSLINGGVHTTIASGVTSTNYQDSELNGGTVYYYLVSAMVSGSETPDSAQVTATTFSATYGSLVHRYSFNENGGVSIADSVGGPIWNGALPAGGVLSGGQLTLASNSLQYAALPAGIVSSLSNLTVMAWVNLVSVSDWARIFDFGNDTTTNLYLTAQDGLSGTVRFGITTNGSGAEQQISCGATLSIGVLHQLAVSLNSGTGILYVDGVAVGTNASITITPSGLGNTMNNYIGKAQYSVPYLNGSLDEFRIYNIGLSSQEITATMALGPGQLLSTNSPATSISMSGNSIVLLWPLASAGFNVQFTTNLASGDWTTVTISTPEIVGGQWQVTLPPSDTTASVFYRLAK